jgi:FkbM family methyltransferase
MMRLIRNTTQLSYDVDANGTPSNVMASNPQLKPYANNNEDLEILLQFPDDFTGYACELGALDGRLLSNTLMLEEKGWTVLCIEPNPKHWDELARNRRLIQHYACSSANADDVPMYEPPVLGSTWTTLDHGPMSELSRRLHPHVDIPSLPVSFTAQVRTLDHCLAEARFPRLDVLSLDVDGLELEILKGLTWNPTVVCVEATTHPSDPVYHHLLERGYRQLRYIAGGNMILRNDHAQAQDL